MNRRNFLRLVAAAVALPAVPLPAVAAGAPVRPINLIAEAMGVPAPPIETLPDWMFPVAIQKISLDGEHVLVRKISHAEFYKEKP